MTASNATPMTVIQSSVVRGDGFVSRFSRRPASRASSRMSRSFARFVVGRVDSVMLKGLSFWSVQLGQGRLCPGSDGDTQICSTFAERLTRLWSQAYNFC